MTQVYLTKCQKSSRKMHEQTSWPIPASLEARYKTSENKEGITLGPQVRFHESNLNKNYKPKGIPLMYNSICMYEAKSF